MTRRDDPAIMAEMRRWQEELRTELELADLPCDTDRILELASVIARQVVRPAVPVTAYLVGLAVGLAAGRGEDVDAAAAEAFAVAMDH